MLIRQMVPVSCAKGLDTKTDQKQVIPGKLLLLENGVFTSPDSYRKRYGFTSLGRQVEGSVTPISQGKALMTYKDELNLFDGANLFSYSQASSKYTNKGAAVSLAVSTKPVVANAYQQTSPNSSYHPSGLILNVWEDTRGGCRYSVIDRTTGQYIVQDILLNINATLPKVFSLGQYFIVMYINSSTHNLDYIGVQVSDPTNMLSPVTLGNNVNVATGMYDACFNSDRIFMAYNNSDGGGGISVLYLNKFLVVSSVKDVTGEVATSINIIADAAQNVWITYYNGTKVRGFVWNYALGPTITLAPTDIETLANVVNICAYVTGTTASVFYEVSNALSYNQLIRTNTLTLAGTAGTASVFLRSVGLYSKPFLNNSQNYLVVTFQDSIQPTYFVVRSDSKVVGKIAPLSGGGLTTKPILTEVSQISPGLFGLSYLIKDLLTSVAGKIYTQTGVNRLELNFGSQSVFLRSEIGNNLHFTGGFVSSYDGASVVEHNFHLSPGAPLLTPFTTGGGIGKGVYSWVAVYEWADNYGQIQRSTPSVPQSLTVPDGTPVNFTGNVTLGSNEIFNLSSTAGLMVGQTITGPDLPANTHITRLDVGALHIVMDNQATATVVGEAIQTKDTNRITVGTTTLRLTDKKPPVRTPVSLVFYRTEANGTVYRRTSSVTSPLLNDPTVDGLSISDITPDQVIIGNQQIYTTGELENDSAPASDSISIYKNRIMLVPSESKSSVWYSKQVVPGSPVEFSLNFVMNINAKGGDITAHIEMDDKFIIWKNNFIFGMVGEGPGANGSNNDFSQPQLIPSPVGCDNPRSVILVPQGAIFHSAQGFWMLTRNLEVMYIGSSVEAFNSLNITGAVQIPDTTQIRFTSDSGTCLVYDYFIGEWSVFKNYQAQDVCLFQGEMTHLQSDGQAMQGNKLFTDNGAYIKLKIITSWWSLAGLQGFQRAYKLLILGDYKSPHKLLVQVAYDFIPIFVQADVIDAGTLLNPTTYGADSPYGLEPLYGGAWPLYQWRVDMQTQKCEAIQFSIEDIPSEPYGEGFSLSNLAMEIGVKKGLRKIPAAASFG